MTCLYEFRFGVDKDALSKLKFKEAWVTPKIYSTIVSGLAINWQIEIYPKGLMYEDGSVETDFMVGIVHEFPFEIQAAAQLQFLKSGEQIPGIINDDFLVYQFHKNKVKCMLPKNPELETVDRLEGRVLVVIDTKDVSSAAFLQQQKDAVKTEESLDMRCIFDAGLRGDLDIGDARIRCTDGYVRAGKAVICAKSDYFLRIFRRMREQGAERELVARYSVGVVSAALQLLFTFTLPALDGWETEELGKLLKFGNKVHPDGLALLRATVEQILLERDVGSVEALGDMATFAADHELRILGNATHVRLAKLPFSYYEELRESVDDEIWEEVGGILTNRVDGISYEPINDED